VILGALGSLRGMESETERTIQNPVVLRGSLGVSKLGIQKETQNSL